MRRVVLALGKSAAENVAWTLALWSVGNVLDVLALWRAVSENDPLLAVPLVVATATAAICLGLIWVRHAVAPAPPSPPPPPPPSDDKIVQTFHAPVTTAIGKVEGPVTINPERDEFADAPHLVWHEPRVIHYGDVVELDVSYMNTGIDAMVVEDRASSDDTSDVIRREEQKIGVPIPRNAKVGLRICLLGAAAGMREIKWTLIYFDTQWQRGYRTACSATVQFDGETATLGPDPSLDRTGARTRHADYMTLSEGKRRSYSTGPRQAAR